MTGPRWTFYDSYLTDTATFEVNPNEGGSPNRKKNLSYQPTTAPDGAVLLFEGRDPARTGQFSGTLLTEAQYDMFETWFSKRYPITMTDDLDRDFLIYITEYNTTRKRAVHYPFKHEYTVSYVLVEL